MHALWLNLGTGLRLALLRPVNASRMRISNGQFWLLGMLNILIWLACDWILAEPPREFNPFGTWEAALYLLALALVSYLVARLAGAPQLQFQVPFCVLGSGPWLLCAGTLSYWLADRFLADLRYQEALAGLLLGWLWLVVVRAQRLGTANGLPRRMTQALLLPLLLLGLEWYYPQPGYWYTGWEAPETVEETPGPAPLNAEQVLFDQPGLLADRLRGILPEAAGQADLFVIGFAGFGGQNVFRDEVLYLEELANTALESGLRFMPLVNHRDSVQRLPIASLTNLEATIESLGRMMNPEEDVLFLYLTSHGTEDHRIAIELDGVPLEQITPESLATALERARARWKILVISACFSGGYLQQLSGPDTLVITAARADRHSFGCDDQADLTWFGRAFLEQGLALGLGFEAAFLHAETQIRAWETEQALEPSEPQIHLGTAIREKLREMDLL